MEAAVKKLFNRLKEIHASEHPDLRSEILNDWEPIEAYLLTNSDLYVSEELTGLAKKIKEFRGLDENYVTRINKTSDYIAQWIDTGLGGGRRRRRRATKKARRHHKKRSTRRRH